jgi:hypothetical protein
MFGFLVVLGVITIPGSLMPLWVDGTPDVLTSFRLFDTRLVVTSELLKASAFLAGFTALQFTVSLLSDDNYQKEFLHELNEELRESLAARAVYLAFSIKQARPSS